MKRNPTRSRGEVGDFGSREHQEYYGLTHGSRPTPDRAKRVRKASSKAARASDPQRAAVALAKKMARVLGPTGHTHAIKLIPISGHIDEKTIEGFLDSGWQVFAAGTAPGKIGTPLFGWIENPTEEEFTRILGPRHLARAIVIASDRAVIDEAMVNACRGNGYDVGPAPKKYREGVFPVRNPTARHRKHRNPARLETATEKAIAKAKEWFGDDALVTVPELIAWEAPQAAVLIGRIVALEYESDKFDGRTRIYRHQVDRVHDLAISIDGGTLMVFPAFRVTKRGIEG